MPAQRTVAAFLIIVSPHTKNSTSDFHFRQQQLIYNDDSRPVTAMMTSNVHNIVLRSGFYTLSHDVGIAFL